MRAGASWTDTPGVSQRSGQAQFIEIVSTKGIVVTVLAGEGAPTVTEGYSKWVAVPRPQREAVTVFAGYEPLALKVPILFAHNPSEQNDLEKPIQVLEYLARVPASGKEKEAGAEAGYNLTTQLVYVRASDGKGNPVPLVPEWLQGIKWVITAIEWDTSPERNEQGRRIRQAGTITFWAYRPTPEGSEEMARLRGELAKSKPDIFKTTVAVNTIKLIAKYYHNASPEAWQEIIKANHGNKKIGTNPSKVLPAGTKVKVPVTVINLSAP
jgi:hypothetical protein